MQPYLMYGYGFRSKNLPVPIREKLINLSEDIFCWFYEDSAGSSEDDAGIFYIISASPWSQELKPREHSCYPWAADINQITKFKETRLKDVDAKLLELELEPYRDKLEFLVSVTEV